MWDKGWKEGARRRAQGAGYQVSSPLGERDRVRGKTIRLEGWKEGARRKAQGAGYQVSSPLGERDRVRGKTIRLEGWKVRKPGGWKAVKT